MMNWLMSLFSRDIGIDLGTANTLVYVRGKGIVLREPSVVAIDTTTSAVLAVGDDAKLMIGRTPGNIRAIRPIRDGVIADFDITAQMLKHFMLKVHNSRTAFLRPRVVICVPSGVTPVEKKAVKDATKQAGARDAFVIEEPMAAAIGAGLSVHEPAGHMVVDIGGGTSEVGVISLGGIVYSKSIRVAGDELDRHIMSFVKKRYNLLIGERSAEALKIDLGSASIEDHGDNDPDRSLPEREVQKAIKDITPTHSDEEIRAKTKEIRGRDMVTGLPKTITITGAEIQEALLEPTISIVLAVKAALEQTPPELASDIIEAGLTLTGGGALLRNLDYLLTRSTGVRCYAAEDPLTCVVKGTGVVLEELETIQKSRQLLR